MTSIVLYFQVHQPWRLRPYSFFDIGGGREPFDDAVNRRILRRVARRCYVPATRLLADLVERSRGRFRCAVSITGTAIDQMERWAPEALASFRRLVRTGGVEVLGETSHHSLAFGTDPAEFRAQVLAHAERVEALFGARPTTFRNTELVFDDSVARTAEEMGFDTVLAEGADHLLGWRSPRRIYRPSGTRRIRLLLRSYRLSDDVAFRFSDRGWAEWPLTAEKFARWLAVDPSPTAGDPGRGDPSGSPAKSRSDLVASEAEASPLRVPAIRPPEDVVGLFMDFETAGEHQHEGSGILRFLQDLPDAVAARPGLSFATPREAAAAAPDPEPIECPRPVSWADAERDLSAWLGNAMQRAAHDALYALLPRVRRAAEHGRSDLLERWRRLSTSDHVYYMCTKHWSDGAVHKYFSPYDSPHEAHAYFLNALEDLERRACAVGSKEEATR